MMPSVPTVTDTIATISADDAREAANAHR